MNFQIEVAKELLNTRDSTAEGILLAVIVVLLTALGILWRAKCADEKYIRENDKANLIVLQSITEAVANITKVSTKNGEKIGEVHIKASSILDIIKERLAIK
jgi:hypothetical protein